MRKWFALNQQWLRRPELVAVWKIASVIFILIFAYVKFMVFGVYLCEKKHTSPWLYWNGGDLRICVQYSLFCIKYIGENTTFRTKTREILNNWWVILVLILSSLKYWRGVISNFENVSNKKKFHLKCSETKSKNLYSIIQS